MNAIIIVHTSLYIYGSIFVGFVIITFLADWMCGIENMYLCNCIVCLMDNSFLEEKNMLFTCLFLFPFLRGECKFCVLPVLFLSKETLFSFRTALWGILLSNNRSIVMPVLNSSCFVKWTFIWKTCRLNPTYRANCNSLVLNWLQEQSTCHI